MALYLEDKEVKFDIPYTEMRLKTGEKVIDRLENIEDTKGNSGDRGRLIITNLRILWYSISSPRVNLSIGYNCMMTISTKTVNSKLRGVTQALHILTSSNNTRFEFIFTNLVPGNMRHFTSVMGVHKYYFKFKIDHQEYIRFFRAYMSSKLYRELKLRGAVVNNKQLKILPSEQVYTTLNGVWNLSSDQGSLGTFIVTNIENIKVCESKFGTTLVVTSSEISGGFILGFRVDPEERMQNLYKELTSLCTVYSSNPIYGVEYKWSNAKQEKPKPPQTLIEDVQEIEEPTGEMSNTLSAYLADGDHSKDRPPVYSEDLGLAIEEVKDGFTLQKLWEVLPA